MNKLKIYMLCLPLVLLLACSKDDADFDNKAYLIADTPETTFLVKQGHAEYTASLNVGIARPATEEIRFSLKTDNSLVAVYNNIFEKKAVALPEGHYTLLETDATIAKESVRSTDVDIEFVKIDQLDKNILYVLPVTIAKADKIGLLESHRTHYYLFKGGALIDWVADIEENNFPVDWKSNVNDMSEITVEGLLYLRHISRDGSDSQIMTLFGVENVFLIRLGDTFDPGQIMVVAKSSGGKYPMNASERTTAPVGRWFHLAVTLDTSDNLRIYLDGELMSTSGTSSGAFDLSSSCYIGKSYNDNRWWPGMMCEMRIWNKARTQAEIASSMYEVDAQSDGLIAYWKFNEGDGNTVADHSGNNNTITAESALKWTGVSLP